MDLLGSCCTVDMDAHFDDVIIGNSSQVSDGAAAVLLMRRDVAIKKGFPIFGVFRFRTFPHEYVGNLYMQLNKVNSTS